MVYTIVYIHRERIVNKTEHISEWSHSMTSYTTVTLIIIHHSQSGICEFCTVYSLQTANWGWFDEVANLWIQNIDITCSWWSNELENKSIEYLNDKPRFLFNIVFLLLAAGINGVLIVHVVSVCALDSFSHYCCSCCFMSFFSQPWKWLQRVWHSCVQLARRMCKGLSW